MLRLRYRFKFGPVVFLGVFWLLSGCHGYRGEGISSEAASGDLVADAYSFDARMWRDGKPTTFKLEIYRTDSLLGLSGRGYLGKGALKGWLTADSLKVYFPASNEYVYESLADLAQNKDCPSPLTEIQLLSVLVRPADSLTWGDNITIASDYDNPDRPEFVVTSHEPGCAWSLDLRYDLGKNRRRLHRFELREGESFRMRGVRDRYKADATIPWARFQPLIPAAAVRISP